mmetsp:Transcript_15564/g.51095  ORF Transcript_15564/g.51095 Transcript_15564/m.51095 type:complete len:256 (-) Transcript_15564:603-1370(-)
MARISTGTLPVPSSCVGSWQRTFLASSLDSAILRKHSAPTCCTRSDSPCAAMAPSTATTPPALATSEHRRFVPGASKDKSSPFSACDKTVSVSYAVSSASPPSIFPTLALAERKLSSSSSMSSFSPRHATRSARNVKHACCSFFSASVRRLISRRMRSISAVLSDSATATIVDDDDSVLSPLVETCDCAAPSCVRESSNFDGPAQKPLFFSEVDPPTLGLSACTCVRSVSVSVTIAPSAMFFATSAKPAMPMARS